MTLRLEPFQRDQMSISPGLVPSLTAATAGGAARRSVPNADPDGSL
jgi:hypothetical protein